MTLPDRTGTPIPFGIGFSIATLSMGDRPVATVPRVLGLQDRGDSFHFLTQDQRNRPSSIPGQCAATQKTRPGRRGSPRPRRTFRQVWWLYISLPYGQDETDVPPDTPTPSCDQETATVSFLPRAVIFGVPRTTVLSIPGSSVDQGTSFPELQDTRLCADCACGRIIAWREKGGMWKP